METALVRKDVFDIAKRVREIDRNYQIRYNHKLLRYELHHKRNYPNTLEAVIPYKNLDKRTIDYVQKTRIKNLDNLIAEIEMNNKRLEKQSKNRILDEAVYKTKDILGYIEMEGIDIPSFNDI